MPSTSKTGNRVYKVLLVDDEARVTESIRLALRKEPFEILMANSGLQALATLAEHDVAAVVSDERMPGMCGSELLAEIHRLYPCTISMILSGQASMDAAIRAINAGRIFRFFQKPIDHAELKLGIHSAIKQHELQRELEGLRLEKLRHEQLLEQLESMHPGITAMDVDEDGAFVLDSAELH